ncbi:MAG: hypothetical protein IPN65_06585 [Elusimicrobia bacterium]|jgi:hypothetical protein|nr:hypothetical protein [Elusimicrobiota bacterium]MBK7207724.1 hypothetical protein [Elusimicrobiota bacterium]MBK7544485.1 hypothetical protein [Elusimicrobiota bacterium]MBK7574008.1 hypothetical protein [Elusimicrobiota bacterium]MBK7689043.1 hypothetical protein [Elusimicrobiota bacterium]
MKRWVWLALTVGIGLGAAGAASVRAFRQGVYYSNDVAEEKLDFGTVDKGARFSQGRSLGFVPAGYGRLVGITSSGANAVLWFEDEGKTLRNVWVEDGRLVRVHRGGTFEDRP